MNESLWELLQEALKALAPFARVADKYDFWHDLPEVIEFPSYSLGEHRTYQSKAVITDVDFYTARNAHDGLRELLEISRIKGVKIDVK